MESRTHFKLTDLTRLASLSLSEDEDAAEGALLPTAASAAERFLFLRCE